MPSSPLQDGCRGAWTSISLDLSDSATEGSGTEDGLDQRQMAAHPLLLRGGFAPAAATQLHESCATRWRPARQMVVQDETGPDYRDLRARSETGLRLYGKFSQTHTALHDHRPARAGCGLPGRQGAARTAVSLSYLKTAGCPFAAGRAAFAGKLRGAAGRSRRSARLKTRRRASH